MNVTWNAHEIHKHSPGKKIYCKMTRCSSVNFSLIISGGLSRQMDELTGSLPAFGNAVALPKAPRAKQNQKNLVMGSIHVFPQTAPLPSKVSHFAQTESATLLRAPDKLKIGNRRNTSVLMLPKPMFAGAQTWMLLLSIGVRSLLH